LRAKYERGIFRCEREEMRRGLGEMHKEDLHTFSTSPGIKAIRYRTISPEDM
jgi:hypothetical protein